MSKKTVFNIRAPIGENTAYLSIAPHPGDGYSRYETFVVFISKANQVSIRLTNLLEYYSALEIRRHKMEEIPKSWIDKFPQRAHSSPTCLTFIPLKGEHFYVSPERIATPREELRKLRCRQNAESFTPDNIRLPSDFASNAAAVVDTSLRRNRGPRKLVVSDTFDTI